MLWIVTGVTFVLCSVMLLSLVYAFTEKQATVAERLSSLRTRFQSVRQNHSARNRPGTFGKRQLGWAD